MSSVTIRVDEKEKEFLKNTPQKKFGKCLISRENSRKKNHHSKWHYRIGDYRILAEIKDNEIILMLLRVGHRREIYR